MPHDPQTQALHPIAAAAPGAHDLVLVAQYEAPAGYSEDLYREFDAVRTQYVMAVLQKFYPGHLWHVVSDEQQGIVKLGIPILMGLTHWQVINTRTDECSPGLIVRLGGEVLERYRLPRGRFELGSFLDARERHSKLVVPSRAVPH